MKGKLFKKGIAVAAAFAIAVGAVEAVPRIKGEWIFGAGANAENDMFSEGNFMYQLNDDGESVTVTHYLDYDNTTIITIPSEVRGKRVTKIGGSGFIYYPGDNLKYLIIPDSVTSIEEGAFNGFSLLEGVTIPDSVTSIGRRAFIGCENLLTITIPDGVTSIEDETFSRCNKLWNISIPDSVTSIGEGAFENCDSFV